MTSTKLEPVRTSCDLPMVTVTMAVRVLPLIWMTRSCAWALPAMNRSIAAKATPKAIATIAQPAAAASGPVRTPPGEAGGIFAFMVHDTLPSPLLIRARHYRAPIP